ADGHLTLGTLLLSFQLVQFATQFAQGVDIYASAWQYMVAAQGRISELLLLGRPPVSASGRLGDGGLEVRAMSIRLGDREVFADFDLRVEPGELVVVHGSPGSGKTTLAHLVVGALMPHAGSVAVGGSEIARLSIAE